MLIRLCPNTCLMASTIRARMPEPLPYLNKDRWKFAVRTTVQSKISTQYNMLLTKKPVRSSSWQLKIVYIQFITAHCCPYLAFRYSCFQTEVYRIMIQFVWLFVVTTATGVYGAGTILTLYTNSQTRESCNTIR